MSNRRWLNVVEYVSFSGSIVGLIASVVSQQAIYASAPLSFCILMNLVNRRRLDRETSESILPTLDQFDRRLAKESKALQALQRRVLALPSPDDLGSLKEAAFQADRDIVAKLSAELALARIQLQDRLSPLEALDLDPLHSNLAQLQDYYADLQRSLVDVTHQVEALPTPTRVELLENTVSELASQNTQLQAGLQNLANQLPPDFTPLQHQIDHLSQQFDSLPPPFDFNALANKVEVLRQEFEKSLQAMSTLVPRQDLAGLLTEVERMHQRQLGFGQSMTPLQGAVAELKGQLQALHVKFDSRTEPGVINELKRALVKTASRVTELQRQLQEVVTSQELCDLRAEVQEVVTNYTDDLQQQLQVVQETVNSLTASITSLQNQTSSLLEIEQKLTDVEQVTHHLHHGQQAIHDQLTQIPRSTPPDLIQVQMEILATKVEELQNHLGENHIHDGRNNSARGTLVEHFRYQAPISHHPIEQLPVIQNNPDNNKLIVEQPNRRAVLEDALEKVQERLIVMSSWLEQCNFDSHLAQKLDMLLKQQVQIEVVWSFDSTDAEHIARRINQPWEAKSQITQLLPNMLNALKPLSKRYPDKLKLRALDVQEQLLIYDRAFAMIIRRSPSTVDSIESEVGLCTTDLEMIQHLIDSFDHPILEIKDPDVYFKRAAIRYDLGDLQGVIADYTQGLRSHPQDETAYNNRGVAYYDLGGRERAIEDFDQALIINPNYAAAYFNRGMTRSELGDKQGAIEDYTAAIQLNAEDDIAYNNRGLVRSKAGDYQGANLDYTAAIRINPDNEVPYKNRGLIRSRLGDKQGAIDDYTEAIRINPKDDAAYFNRGAVRASQEDYTGAIADYTAAIRIDSTFVNAYNNRGFIYQKLGEKQAAIADFDRAIEINPNFANAYNNRGTARSKLKDFVGAIADFDRAIEINPNFANAYNNRGTARSKLKDFVGAIADFDQALQINPNFANAYNNRGLTRSDMGDTEGAIEDMMKAARLFCAQGNEVSSQQAVDTLKKLQQH